MSKLDRLMLEINDQGQRREEARRHADDALREIQRLARAALKAGGTKTEIAAWARISRPTLDKLLK